jgi:superfamily II DNA helicase RecQ
LSQKELVEFGYGHEAGKRHCLGLLSPGSGKSEVYLVPTIARMLAKKSPKLIIHVSPYSFLTGYLFSQARTTMQRIGMNDVSILSFTGREIHEGNLPVELQCKSTLPHLLFLNVDAMHNLFFSFVEELKSWASLIDKIVLDEVHTVFSELAFRQKYRVYFHLSSLGIPIVAMSGSVPFFSVPRLVRKLCLSTNEDLLDMKVIRGGDVIGDFPLGFKIRAAIEA